MWAGCRVIWSLLIGLFRSRATLEAENLVLRQQILVLRRTAPKRLSFNALDRLILVVLYRLFPHVRSALAVVRPETAPVFWPQIVARNPSLCLGIDRRGVPERKRLSAAALSRPAPVRSSRSRSADHGGPHKPQLPASRASEQPGRLDQQHHGRDQIEHGQLDLGKELNSRGAHEAHDQRADERPLQAAEAPDDDDDEGEYERI